MIRFLELLNSSLLCFLFLMSFNAVVGQPSDIDSLKYLLIQHKSQDTIRVDLLTQYSHVTIDVNIEDAEKACEEARVLSEKLEYATGIADVNYENAWIEITKSNYKAGIQSANKALLLYRKLRNKKGESFSLNCIGSGYYYQSDYQNAMEYFSRSAVIDEERNDLKGMSGSYLNIGNILADQANYEESLNYYFKALELKKKVKDAYGVAKCLGNIGSIFGEQGNYPKALMFFKQAQAQHEKLGNTTNAAICHLNIGSVYMHQERYTDAKKSFNRVIQFENITENKRILAMAYAELGNVQAKMDNKNEALSYYNSALKINRETNNKREIARNLNNIGGILVNQNKLNDALNKFIEAKKINEDNEIKMGLCSSLIGIGNIHLKLGHVKVALENAQRARSIAYESNFLALQRDVSELLSKIFVKKGQHAKALKFYQDFKEFSDSVLNKDKIKKIAQIEYDFKYQKELEAFNAKEKKLSKKVESTSKDLEVSNNRLLWGVILFLAVLLFGSLVIFQLRLRNVKSKIENRMLEQKLLRSQMTPHFIFNSLSVLQGMILNKEEIKANNYLSKFSRLLRITLESSREKMTLLSQELLAMEHYTSLQNLESENPFDYIVYLKNVVSPDKILIPPMLIQPFIENAIEHGFSQDQTGKKVELSICFKNDSLFCVIKDNGVGLNTKKTQGDRDKKSMATSISRERIALLSKEMKIEGSIEVNDRKVFNEKGTQVTLIIPHKIKSE